MIDYNNLHLASEFYSLKKFKRIEVPWTVSPYVDELTKPKDRISYQLKHNNKCLVASGEQSFLYLALKSFLPLGQYQAITPCFRDELFDVTHTKYFLKCELFKSDFVSEGNLEFVVDSALEFYSKFLSGVKTEKTENGIDIVYNGVELGSYGIRSFNFIKYIYGTGCAEPRLSQVMKGIY